MKFNNKDTLNDNGSVEVLRRPPQSEFWPNIFDPGFY